MADPKWSAQSAANATSRLQVVGPDAIHLSDGTAVWLEYDPVGGQFALCYSSDHSTRNVITGTISGFNFAGGFASQGIMLMRDNLDNLYVVGSDTTGGSAWIRAQAFTKGAGYTWTAQTAVTQITSPTTLM